MRVCVCVCVSVCNVGKIYYGMPDDWKESSLMTRSFTKSFILVYSVVVVGWLIGRAARFDDVGVVSHSARRFSRVQISKAKQLAICHFEYNSFTSPLFFTATLQS
ncbi:hypothetical protein CCHR01_18748 [Colletotrichum chrysophilum]|uniref:Uncharacterized protein n=1 Tax=Colletotrichum chrysophilum TaxID=1836956 RepID=A0AAD9E8K7_9PEZI|nr:hypothetical protein CCHR01_18748 [Colletotrichum chrysophilum]